MSSPATVAYARRWGWDVVLSTEELSERPASWAKVKLARELLEHYRTVFWIDADALLVDHDRDVLAELQPERELHVACHAQANDPGNPIPNFGVFLLQRSDWALAFLDRLWAETDFIDHNWWENAALLRLLGYSLDPPYRLLTPSADFEHVGFLDLAWNSVPGALEVPRPALRHHARADHSDFGRRLAGMMQDLQQLTDR